MKQLNKSTGVFSTVSGRTGGTLHGEYTKRIVDLVIAIPLSLMALPLMLLLMLLIRLDSSGSPVFTQTRVGRGGRPFTIYKLRTFHTRSFGIFPDEEIRWGDPRVTRAGHLLRRSKLDELLQLVNILMGDMSLVGPRPDIPCQASAYGDVESRRLALRPGLTGIAQISGNTWLGWSQRIQLDLWYIDNRSLLLDLKILLLTIPVMLRGERRVDDPLNVCKLLSINSP
ncbi:MAG: UDP-phosphate glucose phosphotransferase [Gammaproteobacteria bacterium]|nr:MAG: UDP-phosphate glucose phosphotransferase [Gammaproteobacteria bacterium]TND04484.1 MAG: UDP-phosphate glucose phosphotransferase [Gammaproteobacteria bacterium]